MLKFIHILFDDKIRAMYEKKYKKLIKLEQISYNFNNYDQLIINNCDNVLKNTKLIKQSNWYQIPYHYL